MDRDKTISHFLLVALYYPLPTIHSPPKLDKDVAVVLEPPSPGLMQLLEAGGHCHPSDWRRARRIVRRLAVDLPAFDSVWLDALVQLGCLTSWQAEQLAAGEDPTWGDYWRLRPLTSDEASQRWIARPNPSQRGASSANSRGRPGLVTIRQFAIESPFPGGWEDRCQQLVSKTQSIGSPQIAPLLAWQSESEAVCFVSQAETAQHLGDLLVRRGRFPAQVVADLVCQTLQALDSLHAHGIVHGELCLEHLRLDRTGRVILTDAGIKLALHPVFSLHQTLSRASSEVLAPEIAAGRTAATPHSDFYALGCLAWRLLAGRSPFLTADPFGQLAAHRTQRIGDVRDWAPDVPPALAALIQQLTDPDPAKRPESGHAGIAVLGPHFRTGPGRLREFVRRFDHSAAPSLREQRAIPVWWPWTTAALLLVATVLGLRGWQSQSVAPWPWPPQAALPTPETSPVTAAKPADSPSSPPITIAPTTIVPLFPETFRREATAALLPTGLRPLPAPTSEGIVLLRDEGPYAATPVSFAGVLTIRASAGVQARIELTDQDWVLTGQDVLLERLTIQRTAMAEVAAPLPSVRITANRVLIANCCLADMAHPSLNSHEQAAVVWQQPLSPRADAGQLRLRNSLFQQAGVGLQCDSQVNRLLIENVLKTSSGPLVSIKTPVVEEPCQIAARQTTLRESGALVRLESAGRMTSQGPLQLELTDCVFAPAAGQPALLEWLGGLSPSTASQHISCGGQGSLLSTGAALFGVHSEPAEPVQSLESLDIPVDGLTFDQFEFTAALSSAPQASALAKTQAPRLSPTLPGIHAAALPSPDLPARP